MPLLIVSLCIARSTLTTVLITCLYSYKRTKQSFLIPWVANFLFLYLATNVRLSNPSSCLSRLLVGSPLRCSVVNKLSSVASGTLSWRQRNLFKAILYTSLSINTSINQCTFSALFSLINQILVKQMEYDGKNEIVFQSLQLSFKNVGIQLRIYIQKFFLWINFLKVNKWRIYFIG